MKFYELLDDVHIPGRWHLGLCVGPDGEEPEFSDGSVFEGSDVIVDVVRQGMQLDWSETSFGVPVAAANLAGSIERVAPGSVQLVGVRGVPGFVVVNILPVVDCVDESRSEFTKWKRGDHREDLMGEFRMFTKMRLDVSKIPGDTEIFRVARWFASIVVSEKLRDEMLMAGCCGAVFERVD